MYSIYEKEKKIIFESKLSTYKEEKNKKESDSKIESRNIIFEIPEKRINKNYDVVKSLNKKTKIFIRNIDYKDDVNELTNLFNHYGPTQKVKIFKNKGKNNCTGFVLFKKPESANSAMNNSEKIELMGKNLKLEYWKSKIDRKMEKFEERIKEKIDANKKELEDNFEEKLLETNKIVGVLAEINIESEKYIITKLKKQSLI